MGALLLLMCYIMFMDNDSLEEQQTAIKQQFTTLQEANNNLAKQVTQNNEELLKLSGEHRLVTRLIEDRKKVKNKEPKKNE